MTGLAASGLAVVPWRASGQTVIALRDRVPASADAGPALQRALDQLEAGGGGTLRLDGRRRGGHLHIRGSNITIDGAGSVLLDTRLVIAPTARGVTVRDLTILETRADPDGYLLDISGSGCFFENVRLEKRPMAGGYQGYLRAQSQGCRFTGLQLAGSNGLFVAGTDHLFDGFEFISTLRYDVGGDDAFAIKAAGTLTRNITIRNGIVRGFAAAVSIGSEIGSNSEFPAQGKVSGITVHNVTADRCQMLASLKPGALIYDWRDGIVEDISLSQLRLIDRGGFLFARGIAISAARGATVRGLVARDIVIAARAHSQGVMPTAAVDIVIRPDGRPATIEDMDLALSFDGSGESGYPVDHIVRVEKDSPAVGRMRNISIDVEGSHSRISGVYIGSGLDDAVSIRRARLEKIGLNPPSSLGAAGIWSDSRFRATDVRITTARVPQRGGRLG
jgi:hypothetical protein